MGNQRLENIAIVVGEHFERGRAEKIKCNENGQGGRYAEQKSFDGMVSKRAEIEPAEKVTEVRADATRDEGWEGEVTRTKVFEGEDGSRVS